MGFFLFFFFSFKKKFCCCFHENVISVRKSSKILVREGLSAIFDIRKIASKYYMSSSILQMNMMLFLRRGILGRPKKLFQTCANCWNLTMSNSKNNDDEGHVVRLRGLPWAATASDVVKFFDGSRVHAGELGVHFTYSREGRPSGEAFVEFGCEGDKETALKKNNDHMGQRYIEVFRSKKSEMDWVIKRAGSSQVTGQSDAVVRMRGLPFGCSKEEIAQFFTGSEIVPNGIMLPEDRQGRSTGEAYVQFTSPEIAKKALEKHMATLGHRYIECFPSTLNEAYMNVGPPRRMGFMAGNRPGPYDRNDRFSAGMNAMSGGFGAGGYGRGRGGRNVKGFFEDDYDEYGGGYGGAMGFSGGMNRRGNMRPQGRGRLQTVLNRPRGATPGSHYVSKTGHSVHMRGLPFQAIEQDIRDFFSPLEPVRIEFEYRNGRPTGEADVDFAAHQDAVSAMERHKNYIQDRYIELFLNSTPEGHGCGGGGTGGMGGGYGGSPMGGGRFTGGVGMGGGMNNYGGGGMNNYMPSGGGYGPGGMGMGGMSNNVLGNPNYTPF